MLLRVGVALQDASSEQRALLLASVVRRACVWGDFKTLPRCVHQTDPCQEKLALSDSDSTGRRQQHLRTVTVERAMDGPKRRPGFEKLDADDRHRVLRHLREGAPAGIDERASVPALEALEGLLVARRESAAQKAFLAMDSILEAKGARLLE